MEVPGLGLAISKRITELMGGHVGVDSELDKGKRISGLPSNSILTASGVSVIPKYKDLPESALVDTTHLQHECDIKISRGV